MQTAAALYEGFVFWRDSPTLVPRKHDELSWVSLCSDSLFAGRVKSSVSQRIETHYPQWPPIAGYFSNTASSGTL